MIRAAMIVLMAVAMVGVHLILQSDLVTDRVAGAVAILGGFSGVAVLQLLLEVRRIADALQKGAGRAQGGRGRAAHGENGSEEGGR